MTARAAPGPTAEGDPWGELALVVDTSAWSRANKLEVRDRFREAIDADRLRLSPAVRLELLRAVRGGKEFDELADSLSALKPTPLTGSVVRAAEDAMCTLAHRSSGAQHLPIVDYLTAAAAQQIGAAVLHYDRDYDTLAEVMAFESVWLAPAGSLE